jgi:hypothetical protein
MYSFQTNTGTMLLNGFKFFLTIRAHIKDLFDNESV